MDLETNNAQKIIDKLIKIYFSVPNNLYNHLFSSYNQLIEEQIPYILKEENNYFYENVDKDKIYLHGFKCSNIRIKPSTFENDTEIKFPCEARKNHLNYFGSIIADIYQFVEIVNLITNEKTIKHIGDLEKNINIANIPIMVKSKYCSTSIKKDLRGECKYDPGGYFIVNGMEKVVMSMEKMVDNKVLVFTKKDSSFPDGLIYNAQINSKKNDWSDNLQILTIKNRKDSVLSITTSSQLVDIPLFIFFRLLGIESDQQIISYITNNLEDTQMLNLLRNSVSLVQNDIGEPIKTKEQAITYILGKLKKNKRISYTNDDNEIIQKKLLLNKILKQDLLPHLGEDIPKKIVFISYMANKLLNVMLGRLEIDDRDALQNKRIETPGVLIGQLVRQNWRKLLNEIGKHFKKKNQSDEYAINVIHQIKPSIIEHAIKTALSTGVWGINKTKRGVAQALQRLSWLQSISYLRRILSPSLEEATSKVTSIRHVSPNQLQLLCIVETPEGQKIGIVKSLSMMATITVQNSFQYDIIKNIFKFDDNIKHPFDIPPLDMNMYVKIMINGDIYAMTKIKNAYYVYNKLKETKRNGIIDIHTSILLDISNKEIRIYFDGGRLIRPLLIVNNNKLNLTQELIEQINNNKEDTSKLWRKIINKYNNLIEYEDIESLNYLLVSESAKKLVEIQKIKSNQVDNIDISKINRYDNNKWINYTHCDFHGWVSFGTIAANIPFSNHNYGFRNIVNFSQTKQAMGIYLTSYKDRMDISQILYNPSMPLVQTEAMKYNGELDLPNGETVIIALLSYNGHNQEDSIICNETAVKRGLFRADTLKKYHSEILKNPSTSQDDIFTNPVADKHKQDVTGLKHGNYDKLNDKGYIPEGTPIFNEDIIIGKISPIQPTSTNKLFKDNSEMYKNSVPGVIDRVHKDIFNAERYEMYDVKVRIPREPIIGDKFTNFHAGKGTIGILLPQKDMPFTESGLIPDFIINPLGYPKRMSLGHFLECIGSKIAAETGKFIDGTPFNDIDISEFPKILEKLGYEPYGTETMYCGLTGKKMNSKIFICPSFYMRLRHLSSDKVHGRGRGPRQALTRQPLEGRSKDGGLKIGEMEKDAICAHGMAQLQKERFMESSDITKVHVCNDCGMFAYKVIDKDYYKCKGCKNTTRISAVVIPYAAKLLFQELTSVNILPRIKTEQNMYADET